MNPVGVLMLLTMLFVLTGCHASPSDAAELQPLVPLVPTGKIVSLPQYIQVYEIVPRAGVYCYVIDTSRALPAQISCVHIGI